MSTHRYFLHVSFAKPVTEQEALQLVHATIGHRDGDDYTVTDVVGIHDDAEVPIKTDTEVLEAMIDKHGLSYVMVGLSLVCSEKAAHIRANWPDKSAATAWDVDGKVFEAIARHLRSDG